MQLTLNDFEISVPAGLHTWGDVLEWIEGNELQSGQCITKVLMGEREQVHYRTKPLCDQPLTSVGFVKVESGDFDTVVTESLAELEDELGRAIGATGEIVRLFENRQPREAYERLASLLDSMRLFVAILSEDLGWVDDPQAGISTKEFSTNLEKALEQLIAAQQNGFWVSVCDVLEYEIAPILEAWQRVVQRTRANLN